MDELLAKLAGLLKSQQGQDAGIVDVDADPESETIGFGHEGGEFQLSLEEI
jgi:hypothetical protein